MYAHNGSRFDFRFIANYLSRRDSFVNSQFIGGASKMKAIRCSGLTFTDSFLLISSSLRALGECFKCEANSGEEEGFEKLDSSLI